MKTYPKDDRALRVGDIVYSIGWAGGPGKIRTITEDEIWIEWAPGGLTHIPGVRSIVENHSHDLIRLWEPYVELLSALNEAMIATWKGRKPKLAKKLRRGVEEKFKLLKEAEAL